MKTTVINFDIVKEFIIKDSSLKEISLSCEMSIFILDVYYRSTIMGIPIGYETKKEVAYKRYNLQRVIDGSGLVKNTNPYVDDKIIAYRVVKLIKDKLHRSEFKGTDIESLL